MSKIKIVLVDDETLFRKSVSLLLQKETHLEILFEAENGSEVITFLNQEENLPDIILMDLNMPELNGIETTKKIHEKYPFIKIIALSSYDSKSFILNMIQVGATAFLIKNTSPKELLLTIEEVNQNGFYYNNRILNIIQENIDGGRKKVVSKFDNTYISKREQDVLELICKQYSTTEIGEKLFISPRTVEGHRNNLLLKTESKNTAGLVVFAIQKQLIDLKNIPDSF